MNTENIKQLIKNLRHGDDIEHSRVQFFIEMYNNHPYWCQTLTLRWLVSVVDTFADHGTPIEQSNAMVISVYFNTIKIADTEKLLTTPFRNLLPRLLEDVVPLYDEVNSLKITSDDMPNIMYYRIDEKLRQTPALLAFFTEINRRLAHHSPMLKNISQYHKGFYDKIFFENRKHFKQC